MTDRNTLLRNSMSSLIMDLIAEYGREYVLLALKQISDQQLAYISFREYTLLNEPIIKLYDLIVSELERVLFNAETGVETHDELVENIRWILMQHFAQDRH